MRRKTLWGIVISIALIVMISVFMVFPDGSPAENLKAETFRKLERFRLKKKRDVLKHFKSVHKIASEIKDDKLLLSFFESMVDDEDHDDSASDVLFKQRYVNKYAQFHDILFIDSNGLIFHTVKKESDHLRNIFANEFADTRLSKLLRQQSGEAFVDYEFYIPSQEPAAFFVYPVERGSASIGWIVLQFSINQINTILTNDKRLGRTDEVYLVNNEMLMLTESRFMGESAILKLKVETDAVKAAFEKSGGREILDDYRGKRVYSAYEKFDVLGASWVIIAEIDEDEVITEFFKKQQKWLKARIWKYIAEKSEDLLDGSSVEKLKAVNASRVDINEFARVDSGGSLFTDGVHTCTAVAILYPHRFGYLAHITPTDDSYIANPLTKLILNFRLPSFRQSDLLSAIIRRINRFDIYPYETSNLQVIIVAPHKESFTNLVDQALQSGFELSSIKFVYNPKAQGANILLDVANNAVGVDWYSPDFSVTQLVADVEDLSVITMKVIGYQ